MRLIADGVVDREGVEGLARRVGYTPRHLTRVLTAELGAGPLALARARRAQTARVLIETTDLGYADVAFAAGFSSVRQFNDTVREVYAASPTELRGPPRAACRDDRAPVTLRLRRAHAVRRPGPAGLPGLPPRAGGRGRRTHAAGTPAPSTCPTAPAPCASTSPTPLERRRRPRSSPATFDADRPARHRRRRRAGPPAARRRLRPGRGRRRTSPATRCSARWSRRAPGPAAARPGRRRRDRGPHRDRPAGQRRRRPHRHRPDRGRARPAASRPSIPGLTHLFPDAADAGRRRPRDPADAAGPRAGPGRAVPRPWPTATIALDRGTDRDAVRAALLALPGIGPWTADYVAMRALAHPDVVPADRHRRAQRAAPVWATTRPP